MSTNHNQTSTLYPHQMSKEEFAQWWSQINNQPGDVQNNTPGVIYLGQDSVEETEPY